MITRLTVTICKMLHSYLHLSERIQSCSQLFNIKLQIVYLFISLMFQLSLATAGMDLNILVGSFIPFLYDVKKTLKQLHAISFLYLMGQLYCVHINNQLLLVIPGTKDLQQYFNFFCESFILCYAYSTTFILFCDVYLMPQYRLYNFCIYISYFIVFI